MRAAAALVVVASLAVPARAEVTTGAPAPAGNAIATRVSLRVGGATSDDLGLPVVCVDVRLVAGLGVESCGTGAELWQHDDARQMAHLRATWQAHEGGLPGGRGRLRGGLGLAELQIGADTPGLEFGTPAGDRTAVAGPEAVVQGVYVVPLGRGFEGLATATVGAAYFAHARDLAAPQRELQPFVSIELGLGW